MLSQQERSKREEDLNALLELMRPSVQADGGDLALVEADVETGRGRGPAAEERAARVPYRGDAPRRGGADLEGSARLGDRGPGWCRRDQPTRSRVRRSARVATFLVGDFPSSRTRTARHL